MHLFLCSHLSSQCIINFGKSEEPLHIKLDVIWKQSLNLVYQWFFFFYPKALLSVDMRFIKITPSLSIIFEMVRLSINLERTVSFGIHYDQHSTLDSFKVGYWMYPTSTLPFCQSQWKYDYYNKWGDWWCDFSDLMFTL